MFRRSSLVIFVGLLTVGCSEPPPPVRPPPRVPIPDTALDVKPVHLLPGVEQIDLSIHREGRDERLEEIEINADYIFSGAFDAPQAALFRGSAICEIVKENDDGAVVVCWSAAARPTYSKERRRWVFSAKCHANLPRAGDYVMSIRKTPEELYPGVKLRAVAPRHQ